ncbi:MAG: DNA polymerase III subunit delta' [Chloroflexota bacterium]|nr:DNA polymerase III subunit delta' [Chloroflexota bacterium]
MVRRLARAVAEGSVAHAYLLGGSDHIGKRTVAQTFVRALLCTSEGKRPCGTCRACGLVQSNHHPDFLVLDRAWQAANLPDKHDAQSVSVDAVRLMNNELTRRPHEGQWKVLLVPNVEELTIQAANAFLKTLEEPPPFVVILLTTRDPELVLPTIRSRCQPVSLLPLPIEQVERALRTQWGVEPEHARLLAKLSEGRIGWAIQAVQDDALLEKRREALERLQSALAGNRAERLLMAANLSSDGDNEMMRVWAAWWRDLLLVQSGVPDAIINVDARAALERASQRYTLEQVRDFLRELQRLLRLSQETNANRQLLWEVLLLKLPHPPS